MRWGLNKGEYRRDEADPHEGEERREEVIRTKHGKDNSEEVTRFNMKLKVDKRGYVHDPITTKTKKPRTIGPTG